MKKLGVLLIALSCASAFNAVARSADGGASTKTFPVGKGGTLNVSIRGGNIIINPWEKDEVTVRVRDASEDENTGLTMSQNGKTVSVQSADGSMEGFTLEISVPTRFDLRLQSSSGDIEINGPLTGSLKGTTGGGNIHLGNVGGTIDMKTSGGNISCGDVGGDLDLTTSGGDISMGTVSGNVTVSTSGGDITVSNVGKKVRATTSGGNISVGNVGGEAVMSTAGGDITAGPVSGSASLSTAGGNILLRGAAGTVRATTAGGDLQLENITGTLLGTTAGGNIVAVLRPGANGKSRLSTAGGDIRLSVPENAKATINARIHVRGLWHSQKDEYDIRSDFKMEKYEKDEQGREIRATVLLNGGGEEIMLDAVSGNIEIRREKP
jgi:DUF4097 and DUF4098 domain-containing protein YvlB